MRMLLKKAGLADVQPEQCVTANFEFGIISPIQIESISYYNPNSEIGESAQLELHIPQRFRILVRGERGARFVKINSLYFAWDKEAKSHQWFINANDVLYPAQISMT